MGAAAGAGPSDVFVSWLPPYHDMGLIGAWLAGLCHGFPLVVMSPLAFLAHPARWLRAISDQHGTLSAAPNFAYELCLRQVRDHELAGVDLSLWRLAFDGSETVSPATIRRFTERFAPFGLRPEAVAPAYGLAEAGVAVTFPPLGRGPAIDIIDRGTLAQAGRAAPVAAGEAAALEVVSCGRPLPGYQIRVIGSGHPGAIPGRNARPAWARRPLAADPVRRVRPAPAAPQGCQIRRRAAVCGVRMGGHRSCCHPSLAARGGPAGPAGTLGCCLRGRADPAPPAGGAVYRHRGPPAAQPFVAVANHASFTDGLILALRLPEPICFAAAGRFATQWLTGPILRRIGCEFVLSGEPANAASETRRLAGALRSDRSLAVWPEGALDPAPGLRPFHLGAFAAAGAPVVPVGIRGSREMLRPGTRFPRRYAINVAIGDPIKPAGTGWPAVLALRDQARATVLALSGEPDLV